MRLFRETDKIRGTAARAVGTRQLKRVELVVKECDDGWPSRGSVSHDFPVNGECRQDGSITIFHTPDCDRDYVLYTLLHELGHRKQFKCGMTIDSYTADTYRYESEAWSLARIYVARTDSLLSASMVAYGDRCLSTYKRWLTSETSECEVHRS